jgi:hypothetical protein
VAVLEGNSMRHDQIFERDSYTKVDVAAVWPVGIQVAPLPVLDVEGPITANAFAPTPAAPDVPAAVGGLLAASYAGLIAAFALATVSSGQSVFAITICALFVAIFFAVPRIFFGVEPKQLRRPSLDQFLDRGMETLTGHCTGGAASVQMLIVPVSLTVGVVIMAIASSFIL